MSGPFVVEEIYRQTKGEAIISTEVGQHQMWAAQFYKYTKPRTFLTSGGLGTMGYGLGAAHRSEEWKTEDKVVVNIAGDGCFRMNMNEIATAVTPQYSSDSGSHQQPRSWYGTTVAESVLRTKDTLRQY